MAGRFELLRKSFPKVRIQLAREGLPESGRIGFEIFDRTNFGVTNFQEQVNYQRALEGELVRSIVTLKEVAAARVHLVMAKESLYESADDQTKASVY
jgi:flagellar M-ring protein FliF